MMDLKLTCLAAGIAFTSAFALAESPFANKPCNSYAGQYADDGQPITWGMVKPDDFGPVPVQFDQKGVRQLPPVPAAGVHPRILCVPDDLPDIQSRLKETRCGQEVWKNILSWSHALRGTYDESADYAQPDLYKGDFRGTHGRVPVLYMHDKDSLWNPANHTFSRVLSGDMKDIDTHTLWPVLSLDAFRCWVEGDQAGAKELATAVVNCMRADQAAREADPKKKSPPEQPVGAYNLAYCYDFLFNVLTPDQKTAIHDELAAGTWSHDNYGTFNTAETTRSNWATFGYWLMETLSIEGEEGFNDLKVAGMHRAWRNFFTYGIFPSGAYFEGEAKDQLGMDGVIAFSRRYDQSLAGHPHLRAYADQFLPHSVSPSFHDTTLPFNHGSFVKYDLLGGIGELNMIDMIGLKFMFPDDKIIDWCYRKAIGQNYQSVPASPGGYYNAVLFAAIFACDFDPSNSDASKLGMPPTYFSGERGLFSTRSSWSDDALLLNMQARGASAGHGFADRNSILLVGNGQVWSPTNTWKDDNFQQSEVLIDNHAQAPYAPGKMVDVADAADATFAVGDAKYAWDWSVKTIATTEKKKQDGSFKVPPGWEPEKHCFNDFSLTPLTGDYTSKPLFDKPSWIGLPGTVDAVIRQPNYPVKMAFRTAGVVRGKYPYAMVIDDIQKDDQPHQYQWTLLLDSDVQLLKIEEPKTQDKKKQPGYFDLILTSQKSMNTDAKDRDGIAKNSPMLLVRVLQCEQTTDHSPAMGLAYIAADSTRRLVIPSESINPRYKVLLYPYRQGEKLPKTTLEHDKLSVDFGDYQDEATFMRSASGKTDLNIKRESHGKQSPIITVNHAIKQVE